MDREIKFRAWNVVAKTMIDLKKITPLALNMDTDGLFIPFSDGLLLMQFTGLKDKNGKEIYEGDIVQGFYGGAPKYDPDTIVFEICYFGLKDKGLSLNEWLEFDGVYNAELEIIGNIYEHPHLLNPLPTAQVSDTTKMP